jgi:hypothetical protein
MANTESSEQTLNVGLVPQQRRVLVLAGAEAAPEPLHWALRASFKALFTPSAWLKAYAPERDD